MPNIIEVIKREFSQLNLSVRRIKKIDKFFAIFLITIWIIICYFIPVNYVFEGNLILQSLNFTHAGNNEKLFMQNIDSIKSIDIQGNLEQAIELQGNFSIINNPPLQEKLAKINTLTIELPFPESRFIVNDKNNLETRELSLIDLRIEPEININELAYNSENNKLSFCLNSTKNTSDACESPENIDNSKSAIPIGKLRLELGQKPIEIQLKQTNIPELNITSDRNKPEELILQFTPTNNETINLTLLSPNKLFITLPKLEEKNKSATWFRKDIDVKNVQFTRYENTEKVTDEIETSTILKGEIRLGKEKIELQNNQFLIIDPPKIGIKKIRSLDIKTNAPKGIQTFIIGKSNSIAVGLYPDFPVESIKPNLLSKHLSSEAITAIITFITTLTGILLPRLFPESSDN